MEHARPEKWCEARCRTPSLLGWGAVWVASKVWVRNGDLADLRFGSSFRQCYRKSPEREVNHDSDEVSQQRRPTRSAHRQQEAAPVAEDVQHVDHAVDEVHKQPEEAVVDDEVADAKDFLGGPYDISVLTGYVDHVAVIVRKRLSPLIACSLDTGDRRLISAFMERWHKETSSFHLLVREVTITLNDVASLLHLPITSVFHSFEALHIDEVVLLLVELLECGIYEHFPSVAKAIATEDYHERKSRAYRWKFRKTLTLSMYQKRLDRLS
ncbi:uncharacterized protein LOC114372529 [Glycine soja]|uniref:uncharacterized protein LOC114372529 n=1 Tax=Glycine soja TaxID=3848 RepID=UPI00103EFB43|nr:uncharacterized protein LOC114372529 [Glycine soja]